MKTSAVAKLKSWLEAASKVNIPMYKINLIKQFDPSDVFIGYHVDAPASVILRLVEGGLDHEDELVEAAKEIFVRCATPDAISRIGETRLDLGEKKSLSHMFFDVRRESLAEAIRQDSPDHPLIQVTTFSRLLTEGGKSDLCRKLDKGVDGVHVLNLHQVNSEEQFSRRISAFLSLCQNSPMQKKVLVIQAQITSDPSSRSKVDCAKFSILNQIQQQLQANDEPATFCIALVLQVPRVRGGIFSGFPGKQWLALHIDELAGDPHSLVSPDWIGRSLHEILDQPDRTLMKALFPECVVKAASKAYQSNELTSSRIIRCIEILKNCSDTNDEVRFGQRMTLKACLNQTHIMLLD